MDDEIIKNPPVELNRSNLESRRHQLTEFFKKVITSPFFYTD